MLFTYGNLARKNYLNYPQLINFMVALNDYIIKSKLLDRNKIKNEIKEARIALLSDFTINGLGETLKALCFEEGIWASIYVAPYNQYAQEILNPQSQLYASNPDILFVLLDPEISLDGSHSSDKRKELSEVRYEEIKGLLDEIKKHTNSKIVVNSLLLSVSSPFGILKFKEEFSADDAITSINKKLIEATKQDSQIFIFDTNTFRAKEGIARFVDKKMHYLADMRISPESLVSLAKEYMSYIYPLMSMTKKCLVLDLDNTLWGGILGEDGIEYIKLGPEKQGKPFLDFQRKILLLFERGVILAINSKNNFEEVVKVLREHPYMALKEDNFACIKANWNDKATNIKEIAKELNIGTDSMVFIDDDKTNRELVKTICPDVLVVDLPPDPVEYCDVIDSLSVFNTFSITEDDKNRGKMYISHKKRAELESASSDINSFIKQLNIKLTINKADKFSIPRIAQLTQKTNQFNLTTRRYTEEEIKEFCDLGYIIYYIQIEDRFGDYGITGVSIVKTDEEWSIDTFLLSCRVLGKKIEFNFMDEIVNNAKKNGVKKITAEFIQTEKNIPAKSFLKDYGFEKEYGEKYILKIS